MAGIPMRHSILASWALLLLLPGIVEAAKGDNALNLGDSLYLTVGSRLPGLRQVLWDRAKQANAANLLTRRRAAYVDRVDRLPTRWFGYDGIDVMILATGNRDFLLDLLKD